MKEITRLETRLGLELHDFDNDFITTVIQLLSNQSASVYNASPTDPSLIIYFFFIFITYI